jgi:hypothetical protein
VESGRSDDVSEEYLIYIFRIGVLRTHSLLQAHGLLRLRQSVGSVRGSRKETRVTVREISLWVSYNTIVQGYAVAQWVEALCYKPEGRGFDSRWCPSDRTMALWLTQPPTEMSTRNISWGKGGGCVGLITLPFSCADYLQICEPQTPGTI